MPTIAAHSPLVTEQPQIQSLANNTLRARRRIRALGVKTVEDAQAAACARTVKGAEQDIVDIAAAKQTGQTLKDYRRYSKGH